MHMQHIVLRRRAIISLVIGVVIVLAVVGLFAALDARARARRLAIAANVWSDKHVGEMQWQFISRRIEGIISEWQEAGRWSLRNSGEAQDIQLVIDTGKAEIRIEGYGKTVEGRAFALPKKLKWSVFHIQPGGFKELESPARFAIRTNNSGSHMPEMVFLIGQDTPRGYVSIDFNANSRGMSRTSSAFSANALASGIKFSSDGNGEQKPSIVMSRDEYEESTARRRGDSNAAGSGFPWGREGITEWLKAEETIFRKIEMEAALRDLDFGFVNMESSPNNTGGYMQVRLEKKPFLSALFGKTPLAGFFGGRNHYEVEYTFRHLGEGVWYIRSKPVGGFARNADTNFDCVVMASSERPEDAEARLREGREAKKDGAPTQVAWSQALDMGSKVELIGVCEYPSTGKKWWGPDGAALDYVPCYSRPFPIGSGPTGRAYQIAVRIKEPRPTRMRFEGWLNEVSPAFDVYGRWVEGVQVYVFEWRKPEESVSVTFGYGRDESSGYEEIDFEKISLVPGKNGGFEIKHRPAAK